MKNPMLLKVAEIPSDGLPRLMDGLRLKLLGVSIGQTDWKPSDRFRKVFDGQIKKFLI